MNSHPITLLDPIFKCLDWLIAEYGLYLYMASVFLAPLVIACILAGGFRRRRAVRQQRPPPSTRLQPTTAPPALPTASSENDESQSFSA